MFGWRSKKEKEARASEADRFSEAVERLKFSKKIADFAKATGEVFKKWEVISKSLEKTEKLNELLEEERKGVYKIFKDFPEKDFPNLNIYFKVFLENNLPKNWQGFNTANGESYKKFKTELQAFFSNEVLRVLMNKKIVVYFGIIDKIFNQFIESHKKIDPRSKCLVCLRSFQFNLSNLVDDMGRKQDVVLTFFFETFEKVDKLFSECCKYGERHKRSILATIEVYKALAELRMGFYDIKNFVKGLLSKPCAKCF